MLVKSAWRVKPRVRPEYWLPGWPEVVLRHHDVESCGVRLSAGREGRVDACREKRREEDAWAERRNDMV
jgi:hypothetical protein